MANPAGLAAQLAQMVAAGQPADGGIISQLLQDSVMRAFGGGPAMDAYWASTEQPPPPTQQPVSAPIQQSVPAEAMPSPTPVVAGMSALLKTPTDTAPKKPLSLAPDMFGGSPNVSRKPSMTNVGASPMGMPSSYGQGQV